MKQSLLVILIAVSYHWKPLEFAAVENEPFIEWCEDGQERRRFTRSTCAAVPFVFPYPKCYCLDGIALVKVAHDPNPIREIQFSKGGCYDHQSHGPHNRTIELVPTQFSIRDTVVGILRGEAELEFHKLPAEPQPKPTLRTVVIYNGELIDTGEEYQDGPLLCVQRNVNPEMMHQVRHYHFPAKAWLYLNETCDGGDYSDLEIIHTSRVMTPEHGNCVPECPSFVPSGLTHRPSYSLVRKSQQEGLHIECSHIPYHLVDTHRDLNERIQKYAINRCFYERQVSLKDYKPAYSFQILELLAKVTNKYCRHANIPQNFLNQALDYFKVAHEGRGFYYSEDFTHRQFTAISRLLRRCLFNMDEFPQFTASSGCDRREVLSVFKLSAQAEKRPVYPSPGHEYFDYHVVLDIPWNMLDLANVVCLDAFSPSYRMYHAMEHGIEKLYTEELRLFWLYPNVPKFYYENLFGPNWQTYARNLEKCVDAAYMYAAPQMSRLVRPQWIPGYAGNARARGTLVDPVCRRRRTDVPTVSESYEVYCRPPPRSSVGGGSSNLTQNGGVSGGSPSKQGGSETQGGGGSGEVRISWPRQSMQGSEEVRISWPRPSNQGGEEVRITWPNSGGGVGAAGSPPDDLGSPPLALEQPVDNSLGDAVDGGGPGPGDIVIDWPNGVKPPEEVLNPQKLGWGDLGTGGSDISDGPSNVPYIDSPVEGRPDDDFGKDPSIGVKKPKDNSGVGNAQVEGPGPGDIIIDLPNGVKSPEEVAKGWSSASSSGGARTDGQEFSDRFDSSNIPIIDWPGDSGNSLATSSSTKFGDGDPIFISWPTKSSAASGAPGGSFTSGGMGTILDLPGSHDGGKIPDDIVTAGSGGTILDLPGSPGGVMIPEPSLESKDPMFTTGEVRLTWPAEGSGGKSDTAGQNVRLTWLPGSGGRSAAGFSHKPTALVRGLRMATLHPGSSLGQQEEDLLAGLPLTGLQEVPNAQWGDWAEVTNETAQERRLLTEGVDSSLSSGPNLRNKPTPAPTHGRSGQGSASLPKIIELHPTIPSPVTPSQLVRVGFPNSFTSDSSSSNALLEEDDDATPPHHSSNNGNRIYKREGLEGSQLHDITWQMGLNNELDEGLPSADENDRIITWPSQQLSAGGTLSSGQQDTLITWPNAFNSQQQLPGETSSGQDTLLTWPNALGSQESTAGDTSASDKGILITWPKGFAGSAKAESVSSPGQFGNSPAAEQSRISLKKPPESHDQIHLTWPTSPEILHGDKEVHLTWLNHPQAQNKALLPDDDHPVRITWPTGIVSGNSPDRSAPGHDDKIKGPVEASKDANDVHITWPVVERSDKRRNSSTIYSKPEGTLLDLQPPHNSERPAITIAFQRPQGILIDLQEQQHYVPGTKPPAGKFPTPEGILLDLQGGQDTSPSPGKFPAPQGILLDLQGGQDTSPSPGKLPTPEGIILIDLKRERNHKPPQGDQFGRPGDHQPSLAQPEETGQVYIKWLPKNSVGDGPKIVPSTNPGGSGAGSSRDFLVHPTTLNDFRIDFPIIDSSNSLTSSETSHVAPPLSEKAEMAPEESPKKLDLRLGNDESRVPQMPLDESPIKLDLGRGNDESRSPQMPSDESPINLDLGPGNDQSDVPQAPLGESLVKLDLGIRNDQPHKPPEPLLEESPIKLDLGPRNDQPGAAGAPQYAPMKTHQPLAETKNLTGKLLQTKANETEPPTYLDLPLKKGVGSPATSSSQSGTPATTNSMAKLDMVYGTEAAAATTTKFHSSFASPKVNEVEADMSKSPVEKNTELDEHRGPIELDLIAERGSSQASQFTTPPEAVSAGDRPIPGHPHTKTGQKDEGSQFGKLSPSSNIYNIDFPYELDASSQFQSLSNDEEIPAKLDLRVEKSSHVPSVPEVHLPPFSAYRGHLEGPESNSVGVQMGQHDQRVPIKLDLRTQNPGTENDPKKHPHLPLLIHI